MSQRKNSGLIIRDFLDTPQHQTILTLKQQKHTAESAKYYFSTIGRVKYWIKEAHAASQEPNVNKGQVELYIIYAIEAVRDLNNQLGINPANQRQEFGIENIVGGNPNLSQIQDVEKTDSNTGFYD